MDNLRNDLIKWYKCHINEAEMFMLLYGEHYDFIINGWHDSLDSLFQDTKPSVMVKYINDSIREMVNDLSDLEECEYFEIDNGDMFVCHSSAEYIDSIEEDIEYMVDIIMEYEEYELWRDMEEE